MKIKHIQIIQDILKKENKYDLALKLEKSYYEDYKIDNWNGGIGEVKIYVDPNYYLALENLNDEDMQILIKLFNGLLNEYDKITSIIFAINQNIKSTQISDVIYIFVDEAGDMDFSTKGSKYYMFNFLIKKRPFTLHEFLSKYRYSLLEKNLNPLLNINRLDIEAFHAHSDNKYIKEELFNIISTFNQESIKVYSYILEKSKVNPKKEKRKINFILII